MFKYGKDDYEGELDADWVDLGNPEKTSLIKKTKKKKKDKILSSPEHDETNTDNNWFDDWILWIKQQYYIIYYK